MESAGCGVARLKSQSSDWGRMLHNRRHHPLPPSGVCSRSGARFDLLSYRSGRMERGPISEHGMHDDGKAPRERDARLPHGRALRNCQRPILKLQFAPVAGQHDVGNLIEKRAHPPVSTL
jgi:hypothetical protein